MRMKLLCPVPVKYRKYRRKWIGSMPEISARADWTIEETGDLIRAVELLRAPAEIASALQREENDVRAKIAELGLSTETRPITGRK